MDLSITNYFRVLADDVVLLYDVARIYKHYKAKRSWKEFAQALAVVVDAESKGDYKARAMLAYEKSLLLLTHEEEKKWADEELWDFLQEVVIQFSIEEFLMYPFWAAKVALNFGSNTDLISKCTGMFSLFKYFYHKVRLSGVRGLYEGYSPYISAAYINSFHKFQPRLAKAIKALMIKMPHSPSSMYLSTMYNQNGNGDNQSTPSAKVRNLKSVTSLTNIQQINETLSAQNAAMGLNSDGGYQIHGNKKFGTAAPQNEVKADEESYFMKCLTKVAMFPYVSLSVHMIADPEINVYTNWMVALYNLLRTRGFVGMFRGLRTHFGFSMLPISSIQLLGVYEYFVYRAMLSKESKGGLFAIIRHFLSLLSRNSFINRLPDSYSTEKTSDIAYRILNFGVMTAMQIVPSIALFMTSRLITSWVFRPTRSRRIQIKYRREILESYYNNATNMGVPENEHAVL